jgi:Autographiviridae DNA polymerase
MTKFMVLDLETSISKGPHGPAAKDPTNDFYTIIAGTCPEYVSVFHWAKGMKRTLPPAYRKMLDKTDVLILHNAPFDLSYIWHNEAFQDFLIRGGQVWDTQIAEYLLSGQRHSFASLGELQEIYLGQKTKDSRIGLLYKKGIGADKILAAKDRCPRLFKIYDAYSKADGVTTMQVFQKQYAKAKQLGMINVIKLYNMYMLTLTNVMNTGITVDLEKCEKTLREFKLKSLTYLEEATNLISSMWDKRLGTFNVNSPKDKSAILFGGDYIIKKRVEDGLFKNGNPKFKTIEEEVHINGFGLPIGLSTSGAKAGQYATGADIIEKIYQNSKNEQAKEYCRLQKLAMTYNKMCSTYLEPFLELSIDGKLYPNYNNTMTITSRLSSSKPNLQNIPSKGDMLLPIQGQLVAPEGWVCVSADYSQLEIYVSAYLANDPQLTKDLLDGVDFHVKRLSYAEDMSYSDVFKLCKIDRLPEWESKRTSAKTISYQKAYGASPKSLSKTTGIDETIIKKIFELEDIEYPFVADFNKKVLEQVNSSKELSQAKHLPKMKKGGGKEGKRFICGLELLPIINGDEVRYDADEYRHVGYYTAVTGKRYSFEEIGRIDFKGNLKRGFSTTQTKNYHVQGTASDVQAASSAALLPLLLKNKDKVRMVNEIHDSKWFIVKAEYLEKVLPIIKRVMEDVPGNFKKYLNVDMPFKIPVDFEVGKSFAETESYLVKTPSDG